MKHPSSMLDSLLICAGQEDYVASSADFGSFPQFWQNSKVPIMRQAHDHHVLHVLKPYVVSLERHETDSGRYNISQMACSRQSR